MLQESQLKVVIADKEYSLKVAIEEVEKVLAAEKEIQNKIKVLKASYQVKEKHDLLAMCLLQMVVEKNKTVFHESFDDFYRKIADLESFVSDYLKAR